MPGSDGDDANNAIMPRYTMQIREVNGIVLKVILGVILSSPVLQPPAIPAGLQLPLMGRLPGGARSTGSPHG